MKPITWVPLTLVGLSAAAAGAYLDVLAAAAAHRRPAPAPTPPMSRLAILVPAHNEADYIARSVGSLLTQDYPEHLFRIVVIADNCTDATAAIAASAGASVLVRDNPDAPGKGQALRWAMDQLMHTPDGPDGPDGPDAIVVVDADTVADAGMLRALAGWLEQGASVVQGEYLALEEDASPAATLRAVGLLLFHKVRFSGRAAIGLPCSLVGNGMLFSRQVLEEVPWSAFSSVEDLEYTIDLRLAGHDPVYAPNARLWAPLAVGGRAERVQRLRWEGGRFHVVRTRLPKLVGEIVRGRRWSLLDAAVDLLVPPLGVLTVIAVAGTGIAVVAVARGAPVWIALPWAAASVSIPIFVLGGLASAHAPRTAYRSLALAPAHVASSLLTRLRLFRGLGANTWERTQRPSDSPGLHSNRGNGQSKS
jgi:cellulose synthase/poly-beta-1,6-N-acetylglucosamine synthase-like glycosyltransferase